MPLMISQLSIRANTQHDEHEDGDLAVQSATPKLQRPPLYAVLLLNDDFTTMDFVVEVLQLYFGLDGDSAVEVMLNVHHHGKGVAGVYVKDIAETKAQQVIDHARAEGHPLMCVVEPQQS